MKTEILFIVDRSGSMSNIAVETIASFNQFIDDQRKVKGKARVTFAQFDNIYEVVYQGKKLKEVEVLTSETFQPRGMTAMYDAIGKTLTDQKQRIESEGWAEKVIVVIMTDGGENASQEFNQASVQKLTKEAQDKDWSFVYLGANQDSFATAASHGINLKSASNFVANYEATTRGVAAAGALYSQTVTNLRTSNTTTTSTTTTTDTTQTP